MIEGMFLKTFTVDVEGQHSNIILVRIPEHSSVTAQQVVARLAQVCLAETQVGGIEKLPISVKAVTIHVFMALLKAG